MGTMEFQLEGYCNSSAKYDNYISLNMEGETKNENVTSLYWKRFLD